MRETLSQAGFEVAETVAETGAGTGTQGLDLPVSLTRTEFDLLVTFMSRPRRVWERETLARQAWHTEWAVNDHVIDVHVANPRHKLGENADFVAHRGQAAAFQRPGGA